MIEAAKNWIGEKISHSRKDDIVEFARGNIYYRVGKNGYSADILVGIKKDGSALLHDLVEIKQKEITDVSRGGHNNIVTSRHDASVISNSISQGNNNVKQKRLEIIEKVNPAPNSYNTWIDRLLI